MEKTFSLKLSKKEALVLDHGRFRGMVEILEALEKKVNKRMDDGEKVELSTVVTDLLAHKLHAKKMLNEASKKLSEFSEDSGDKAEESKSKK